MISNFSEEDIPGNKEEIAIIKRIESLTQEKKSREKHSTFIKALSFSCFLTFLIILTIIFFQDDIDDFKLQLMSTICILPLGLGLYAMRIPRENKLRILQIDNEIDLLNTYSEEKKAEKLFRNNQFELKIYYDQTLSHSSQIFYVGIICLAIGFAIIGFTIYYFTTTGKDLKTNDKIVIAALSAIGNVLISYIGAIYLKMFSSISNSLNEFHSKLVLTHNQHFANFLISKINNSKEKDESIKNMISELVKK